MENENYKEYGAIGLNQTYKNQVLVIQEGGKYKAVDPATLVLGNCLGDETRDVLRHYKSFILADGRTVVLDLTRDPNESEEEFELRLKLVAELIGHPHLNPTQVQQYFIIKYIINGDILGEYRQSNAELGLSPALTFVDKREVPIVYE